MTKNKEDFKNKTYTMMKDFDILAMPKETEKQIYEEANFENGIQMMTPTYVRDQDGRKFSIFVSIQEFKQFGPGIYLLFLFLKYATILFLFVSIFSFVNLGILLEGGPLTSVDNNFQINMAKSTLGNVQDKQLVVIIIFDYIMTVIILAGIIFWKQRQSTYVVECCMQIMLPSYQTVILEQIPQLYTESEMKTFLEQAFSAEVQDIYTVRNFNNDLYHYKQITKIANSYKDERALVKIQPERSNINLTKLFFDYEKYYFKMQNHNKLSKYPTQFAYITFKSVKSRQQILKFYKKTFHELNEEKKDNYRFKTEQIKLKACLMEPNGIKWENLNLPVKTKFMWISIQICLLVFVLLISILMIFILYVSQSSMSHEEYYGMSKQKILQLNKKQALQSYCLGLSIGSFNSDSDCNEFYPQYVKFTILFVALPLVVALFKFILTEIMKMLVMVRRHPYQISKIQSQIIIMFVFYFFASGMLQYIAFLEIQFNDNSSFSFVNIISPVQRALTGYLDIDSSNIRMATDFNRTWYTIASYKIILIALISSNVSSFGKIAYSFLRKLACDIYARKQKIQKKLNYWLEGEQMEIQFVYALAATVICFLLLFGSSMPLVYPCTFVSLLILFWSTKFIFINFCARPLLYSHSMNSLIVKILMIGVIIHCIAAPLYFGAQSIHSQNGIKNFLRIPYFGYYIVIIVISVAYMIYREQMSNLFEKVKNYYESSQDKQDQPVQRRQKKMSLPSKLCLIVPHKQSKNRVMTYSMHQNLEYQRILKTLYTINKDQRRRSTCVLNKQLQNLIEKDEAFAQADENTHGPLLFYELLKMTQQNFLKFQKRTGKQYSNSNNPYKFYLKQLKQIERASKIVNPQIYAQIQSQGFMSNSLRPVNLSHLKQVLSSDKNINLEYIKNLQSLKRRFKPKPNLREIVERSDQQSISRNRNNDDDFQEAPNSDVRLRSTLNIGLVSNLGMVSHIGGGYGGMGIISNLGTMSRVRHRNSVQANEQKYKDVYLLDDKFDCIKQTQSILDSRVYSKRYLNEPAQKDVPTEKDLPVQKDLPAQKDTDQNYQIKISHPQPQILKNQIQNKSQSQKKSQQISQEMSNYEGTSEQKLDQNIGTKQLHQHKRKSKSKKHQIAKNYQRERKGKEKKKLNDFQESHSSEIDQSNDS